MTETMKPRSWLVWASQDFLKAMQRTGEQDMAKRMKKATKASSKKAKKAPAAKAPKAKKAPKKEIPLPELPKNPRHTSIEEIKDTVGLHFHVEKDPPKEGAGVKVECGRETFLLVIKSVRPLVNGGHTVFAFIRKGAGDGERFRSCRLSGQAKISY